MCSNAVNGVATVKVAGLAAMTEHAVFCMTASLQGVELPLSAIQATRTSVSTLCCKNIFVRIVQPSLRAGDYSSDAISVYADTPPSQSVQLSFAFAALSGSDVLSATYPTSLSWSNSSSVPSASVMLTSGGAGQQQLSVALSGPSHAEYRVNYIGSRTVTVLAVHAVPEVPSVTSAMFSNDGSSVVLTFDSPTNRGGYTSTFPCNRLLWFNGSADATCLWSDASNIAIYPRFTGRAFAAIVTVGSPVILRAGKITALCDPKKFSDCVLWASIPEKVMTIAPPESAAQPSVSLSLPASIGGCASLTIDVSNSGGSAGRPWEKVEFLVRTATGAQAAEEKLSAFLNGNFTVSPPTAVPPAVLSPGLTYSIQVTLCNFLGACGTAVKSVAVLPGKDLLPVVSILGTSQRTIQRNSGLVLSSNAFTQDCNGRISYANLDVSWTVSSATDSTAIRSSSLNPALFKLDPHTLKAGAQYTVTVTVRSLISSLSSSARVDVSVTAGRLVAKVSGGSQRVVRAGDALVLDASKSYDEDQSKVTGSKAGLSFRWTCLQIKPVFSTFCPVKIGANAASELLNITSTGSVSNTTALITLTVTDLTRTSSAQVEIEVAEALRPLLRIDSAASSLTNVNTDKRLVLFGAAKLQTAGCTAAWSVDEVSMDLSKLALTPVSVNLQPEPRFIPVNLVLPAGSLPQRSTLVFTLSCGGSSNSITVSTNGAPLPGVFLLTPPNGQELSTVFHFSAAQWEDSDIPLTYEFGFQSAASLQNLVVVSRSELSFTSSKLPTGDREQSFRVQCLLSVFDNIGAASTAQQSVIVHEVNQQEQLDSLLDIIHSNVGSVDSTKNIISVVSAALNSVNCSAAPNCSSLNRSPCRKTSGECGACLEGYLGDAGDRSTACIPTHFAGTAATSCTSQSDCLSWQVCDTVDKVCKAPLKSCSRNCSDHGSCLFVNRVSGAVQQECRVSDVNCDAVCSCEGGYSGITCEISTDSLKFRREVRSSLLSSLQNLTAIENANEQVVASWSASLYSLSLNPHEISVNDAARALEIANATVASAKSLNFDSTAGLVGVLQATDTVFSVQKYNYNPNDYSDPDFGTPREYQNNTAAGIVGVVDQFARLVSASMTLGQNATTFLYDNFRISSQVSAFSAGAGASSSGSNISVTSAQSAFEALTGTRRITAVLSAGDDQAESTDASAIATNVISVFPRAYTPDTKQFMSNPLHLQIAVQGADDDQQSSAAEVLSSIEFTFPFNEPQEQFLSYSANFTYTCKNAVENFTFVCPDSGEVLHRNCSTGAGEYTTYCPVPAPTCARLDLNSADITIADSCRVVSYNATYVTCSCALRSSTSSGDGGRISRRLDTTATADFLDETGVTNMLATAIYIGVEFADTFNAADKLNDPSKVILVIIMFATLWGCGLTLLSVCFGRRHVSILKQYKTLSRQVIGTLSNVESTTSMEDARARLLTYIENVFPSVYAKDKNSFVRMLGELRSHHRYLTLFTLADGQKTFISKALIIFQMLTMETMQMFLLAVLYDLQCPDDDGTCVEYSTPADCLARKSIFDKSQTYCKWEVDNSTAEAQCSYQEPYFSFTVFIYILILTSVFTAIINTPLDYFFKVCAAPLIEDALDAQVSNTRKNKQTLASGLRRLSVQTNHAVQAVGRRGSAMVASTQQYVQKKLWYTNLHLTAKEKAADNVIADRAISEDLREVHKQATTGLSSLVRHSETLQSQHQRHTLRLKQRAESRRTLIQSDLRPSEQEEAPVDALRAADSASTALTASTLNSAMGRFAEGSAANAANRVAQRRALLKLQDEVLCQRLLLPKGSEHLPMTRSGESFPWPPTCTAYLTKRWWLLVRRSTPPKWSPQNSRRGCPSTPCTTADWPS